MSAYPQIIEDELPTYRLIADVAPMIVLSLYVVVLFWQMIQTGVAVLWGLLEALRAMSLNGRWPLSSGLSRGAISAAAVALALVLTSIGFIDLIVQRNSLLFVAFVLVFWLPLLTRGLVLVVRDRQHGAIAVESEA
jgi:uncharacterized membrane protein YkvI